MVCSLRPSCRQPFQALLGKLLDQCKAGLPNGAIQLLNGSQPWGAQLIGAHMRMQTRAVECIANLVPWAIGKSRQPEQIYSFVPTLWKNLFVLASHKCISTERGFAEAITSCMCTLILIWKEDEAFQRVLPPSGEYLRKLCGMITGEGRAVAPGIAQLRHCAAVVLAMAC